jgi:hypothetical protein
MRTALRLGWTRWCAAVLLALLAVTMIHAAVPHGATQRDCATCKALSSPGVARMPGGLGGPAGEPSLIAVLPPDAPPGTSAPYLRPLRAPPGSPAL